jgi:integrase
MPKKPAPVRKPRPDFPLFPHQTGRWCKKVRQKLHYFGKTADDPKGEKALALWLEQKDALLAGKTPRKVPAEGLTLTDLANRFLSAKMNLVASGELTQRSFADYMATAEKVIRGVGGDRLVTDLDMSDFSALRSALAKNLGPVALGNTINRIRVLFKWGFDAGLIDRPMRYGPGFKRPSKKTLRLARAAKGPRMFEADELRLLLDGAAQPLTAMILLAANAGLGQSDISRLSISAINFKTGWLDFPRPKTGIPRRCPLWKETLQSVQEAISLRPSPKDVSDAELVFLTHRGLRWVRDDAKRVDSVAVAFGKLMKRVGLNGARNFYAIRHGFQTVGEDTGDSKAVDVLMGHVDESMGATYREAGVGRTARGVSDQRLRRVTDHVRQWLFGCQETK